VTAPVARHHHLLAAAALTLLVLATFGGILRNGFVWDDRTLVATNEALARPDVVVRAFQIGTWQLADPARPADEVYRPLGVLSLAIDRAIGGLTPTVFHAHNLLLHLAVVLLLYVFLARRAPRWAALGAAAWFATLPASVEPVAWIAVRFDLLGAALSLAALLLHRSERLAARVATPLLVLAALLAKETFVVLPALLVLDDWLEERPGRVGAFLRTRAARHAPIAGAVIAYLAMRAAVLDGRPQALLARGAAMLTVDALSTLGALARLAFAPFPLSITRAYEPLGAGGLALVVAGVAVAALAAWRHPPLRLGLAWFALASLLPSLVVRPIGFLGERYLYVPALGLAIALAAGAGLLAGGSLRRAAGAVAAIVVTLQAWASFVRVPDWRDDRTIFGAALDADPASWFAMFELGHADAREGDWAGAASWFRRALRHNRSDGRLLSNAAAAFDRVGNSPAAVEVGRLAVKANPRNPRARYNLAVPLIRLGRIDEARRELDAALAVAPWYEDARALREALPPPP
jgi:tetratricopeptide (TPR) repeat protein